MATGLTHISRAMQHIGALAEGATPSSDEQSVGLAVLNALLLNWSAERDRIDNTSRRELAVCAQKAGQVAALAAEISTIAMQALATSIDGSTAQTNLGTVNTNAASIASTAATLISGALAAFSLSALATFASTSTDNTYTDGIDEAIQFNLAVALAGVFKREVPASVALRAKETLAVVMPPRNPAADK